MFRLSVSSESSRQDPRLFGLLETDAVVVLNLIPFSQSCHYEHAAFSTDRSGAPLALRLIRQQGPLPVETCVFPCQSAETPLATCTVRTHQGLTHSALKHKNAIINEYAIDYARPQCLDVLNMGTAKA